jgi:GGDEF domain-containing protein
MHASPVQQPSGSDSPYCLWILTVFKQVNDAYGHHVGDLLLKSVAIRLSTCVNAK